MTLPNRMKKILIFTASLMVMLLIIAGQIGNSAKIVNATAAVDGDGNFIDSAAEDSVTPVRSEDGVNPPAGPSLTNPLKFCAPGSQTCICDVLSAILDLVVKIGSLIAVLLIIWSGFLFIKAQGKPTELTKAKEALKWTLIGTAVLLGSSVIANIIVNTVFSVTNQATGVTICNI